MQFSKLFIGSDHRGFALKEAVKELLAQEHIVFTDLGNATHDPDDDYPDYAQAVAEAVAANPRSGGLLFCHNGVGVCIVANKFAGIRAVVTDSAVVARESRADDNTNVLCLGGGYVTSKSAMTIIRTWTDTAFKDADRYQRRLDKITTIESKS